MPAVALTSAANNSHWLAAISVAPSSPDFVLATPTISTAGDDVGTANIGQFATTGNFTTITGAMIVAVAVNNDNVTHTGPSLSQTGATFPSGAGILEQADGGTATGNDVAGALWTSTVTTGASGAGVAFGTTVSASSQGGHIVFQQTETAAAAGAAISTLTDEFATLAGATWDTSGTGSWTASGNTAVWSGTAGQSGVLTTDAVYDMTGGTLTWQMPTLVNSGASDTLIMSVNNTALTANWGFLVATTSETFQGIVNGGAAGTSVNYTAGMWFRIREASGTIYLEYADVSAPATWSTLRSTTTLPTRLDRMRPRFTATDVSGSAAYAIAHINLPAGPLFLTVTDDFSGTLSKWEPGPNNFSIVSGALKLTANNTDGLIGMGPGNIVGSAIYWQQTNLVLTGDDYMKAAVYDWDTGSGGWGFYFTASSVQALVNNTPTGPTRTHTNNDFYRIREASGTIYYEYSTNPATTWTQLHSSAVAPPRPDRMEFTYFVNHQTGTCAATINNFNITPPPVAVGPMGDVVEDWETGYGPGDAPGENPLWGPGIGVGSAFISIETASSVNTLFGSTVATTGQALILEVDGSIDSGFAAQTSAGWYDFTDTAIFSEVHVTTSTFGVTDFFSIGQYALFQLNSYDGGSAVSFGILDTGAGVVLATFGDLDPEPAYDPVAHKFLRFRETSGTTYWETSPDRSTWTVIDSANTATYFPGGNNELMQPIWWLQDYDGAAGDIFMMADNINIAPGGNTGAFFFMG